MKEVGGGVGAFYDSLTRCSVPLFFMITGYFLLTGKKESIAVFIRRRFLRVFLPFLMLGFVYAIWKGWDFKELIKAMFIHGPMDYHLWYVYYIIGIYLVIPFLNPIFQLENKKIIEYYILIWFISFIFFQTITGVFNFYWNPFVTFNFYYFQGFLGYVVLGGLLRILFEELNNKQISNIRSFTWINLTLFIFNGFLIFG
ncbi:acyltransferase, partial [Parasutterella excrementihominis]|uniref:acyltransferase n=1 Tax=Parasutterella excrementihominis TaxID=487175 RepID=UPI003AB61195